MQQNIYVAGYIRFGRAALTVGRIGVDYRRTLFKTVYEEPALYETAKKESSTSFVDLIMFSRLIKM